MAEKGRPTKYNEKYPNQAYKLCLLGATDEELANFFEVCEDTINEWKNVHDEFSVSIKKGKINADANVANSLYKRALGYKHDAVKIFADVKTGAVEKVDILNTIRQTQQR
jgi:RNA polymerase-interacting CarD/CdnL/TRCF family regulator